MNNNIPVPDFEALAKAFFDGLSPHIAEKAKGFFKGSFLKGGFTDYSFKAWPARKDGLSHRLMQQSHTLRDSITIAEASAERIVIDAGKGIPYANIHNTGGIINIKVTDKMRKYFWYEFKRTGNAQWKWMALTKKDQMTVHIPQRQFIGESQTLLNNINKFIAERIQKLQSNIPVKTL